jgi:drug/metabolite transporter (DMT)-like permease
MTADTVRRGATAAGFVAVLLWSSNAVLTTANASIPALQLLTLVFAIAGTAGCAWLLRPGGEGVAALRMPVAAAVLTVAALAGNYVLYFIALKRAPVVAANLINYLWPLFIVVFAAAFARVRVRPLQWLGTVLGLSAAVLLILQGQRVRWDPAHAVGYAAAFGTALMWAAYSVLNRRHAGVPSTALFGAFVMVAALGGAAHLAFESWVAPTPLQWAAITAMGLGPTGLAFALWDRATKHGDLAVLGTLSYAAPVLSTGWLLLFGRAAPHWTQAVAVGLLLLGAWLSVRGGSTPES